jgi:iron complex outermembrane receptor protein
MKGTTSGVEVWTSYQAMPRWRLSAGFDALTEHLQLKAGSNDLGSLLQQGLDPKRSWRLRSSVDLPRQGEFDIIARAVSARSNPTVPSYSAVDLRFGWKPQPGMELSVTGQNLFGKSHGEFANIATRTEIGRGVFIKIVSRFGRGS